MHLMVEKGLNLLKCLGKPTLTAYIFSVGLFVIAYIVYWVLITFLRRIFRKDGIWKRIVNAGRYSLLFFLFEIAAVISINILGLNEAYKDFFDHVFTIIIIATVGLFLSSITRTIFHSFYYKYEDISAVEVHQRGMVTQVLFLYRLIMFLILTITLASILMTFPQIKNIGIGILSSAGIAGIALGIAARPILLNIMAGFQIAMTKTIKIGDAVIVEKEFAQIEAIHLTHVIARTWDMRRLILPISYFIDQPFQNWDTKSRELIGSVFVYCDYTAPVDVIRKKVEEIIESHPNWNKKVWRLHVTNCDEKTIELRVIMTANDAGSTFELRCYVREKLIEFLQKEHPYVLPCVRFKELNIKEDER